MQLQVQIPAVWVYTTGSYNNQRIEGYPDYLTPAQKARVERIRQARLLFDGKHREYFLTERRSQFDFPPMVVAEQTIQPYLAFNVLALISYKGTDLLFGDKPLVKVEDPIQQAALEALDERCNLHPLFYSAALDASYEAECFLESCIENGQVCLRQVDAMEIFPVGSIGANGQYGEYVRFQMKNISEDSAHPVYLLLEVHYLPGFIVRKCYQLDDRGKRMGEVDLKNWINSGDTQVDPTALATAISGNYTGPLSFGSGAAGENLTPDAQPAAYVDPFKIEPVTRTGIANNTITWIPNQMVRGRAIDDYDIAIPLQDSLNAKQTQISRVLAKHSDPKLFMPSRMATEFGSAYASDDLFFGDSPDEKPSYITWPAELQHAVVDRDFSLNALMVSTESSPVLLGIKSEGVKVIAYKAIKVMAMAAIKKAERKSLYMTGGVRRALTTTQQLEQTIPGTRYEIRPIGVTLQDGIPVDDIDQANQISILRAARSMSRRRSITLQLSDPAAVEAEITELDAEDAAATPSILFSGEPGQSETPPAAPPSTSASGVEEEADEKQEVGL